MTGRYVRVYPGPRSGSPPALNVLADPRGAQRRRLNRLDRNGNPLALTREDIRGLPALSYLRFSSRPQEKGSSIDRQVETREEVVRHFEFVLDRTIEDRAKSASKGHHRKYGNLAVLLEAARRGDFLQNPTPLIVEAMDRLFREGAKDVFGVLGEMIDAGLIITGDKSVWDEVTVNDPGLSHKLLAEINAAKLYTDRLAEQARGAHAGRRKKLAVLAEDSSAPRPRVNGCLPGWIIETDDRTAPFYPYALCPIHSPTVVRIYVEASKGTPIRVITQGLIRGGVPRMRWSKDGPEAPWTRSRVGAILKDPLVLGYKRPMRWFDGRRQNIGAPVKLFPAAVDAKLWKATRSALEARRTLGGRGTGKSGFAAPNLFTGRCVCPACGNGLRVYTGGNPSPKRGGRMHRTLVCGRWIENKTCENRQRYDLWHFEAPVLGAILELTELAPPRLTEEGALSAELAALEVEMEQKEGGMEFLLGRVGKSETARKQYVVLEADLDEMRRRAAVMRI